MEGQVNPGLFIFWVISSGFVSSILFLVVVFIVESLKPKPPVFLGPRQNLGLQQRIDDQNVMNERWPDGWSYEENEDGTLSAYCNRTGEWMFADCPEIGWDVEKWLRDK